jgi:hypothetical protein
VLDLGHALLRALVRGDHIGHGGLGHRRRPRHCDDRLAARAPQHRALRVGQRQR